MQYEAHNLEYQTVEEGNLQIIDALLSQGVITEEEYDFLEELINDEESPSIEFRIELDNILNAQDLVMDICNGSVWIGSLEEIYD